MNEGASIPTSENGTLHLMWSNKDRRWAIQFSHLDKLVSRTKWTTTKCGSIQLWLSMQSHQIRMFANKPIKAVTLIQIEDRRTNANRYYFIFFLISFLTKVSFIRAYLLFRHFSPTHLLNFKERERKNLNDFPPF